MRQLGMLAALALVFAPSAALAQFGGGMGGMGGASVEDWERLQRSFTVNTAGGNRLVGPLGDDHVAITTEEFGELKVPVTAITGIKFSKDGGEDVVVTATGGVLKGRIQNETINVDSAFGPIQVPRAKLETIERYQMTPNYPYTLQMYEGGQSPKATPIEVEVEPAAADAEIEESVELDENKPPAAAKPKS